MEREKQQIYEFEEFRLDAGERRFSRHGEQLTLPSKAFDLLLVLVENNGRLVTKDELYSRVWHNQLVEDSNLTVQISAIRKALGEQKNNPRFLTTVPGYGYRFTAELKNASANDEILIETETLSRIVIEKEESSEAEQPAETTFNIQNSAEFAELKSANVRRRSEAVRYSVFLTLILAISIGLSFGIYQYLKPEKQHFERIKLTRLTNKGQVDLASIAPDGKYIAYVLSESDGSSLWLRQVGTGSDIRILPPVKADFWGLTFSPDGKFVYYNLFSGDKADTELFRIPSLGGAAEKIPNIVTASIAFSPDGKRIAYILSDSANNSNYLMTAKPDGSDKQLILAKKHPATFSSEGRSTAWSPDGSTIACLVNNFGADGNFTSLVGVDVNDKTERVLSSERWFDALNVQWFKDGSGVMLTAKQNPAERKQVWFISYPNGEFRRITNDLNNYGSLSSTADGKAFAAVQTNTINSIWVGSGGEDFREIVSEVGTLYPLSWTSDGKIVFRSESDGALNFWTMNADGSERRQLTVNAKADWRGMCLSADGKYLVFPSWRSGKSHLWRVDINSGATLQLTDGEADVYPRCSPDNRFVVFQRGIHGKPPLWKVPLESGEAVQIGELRGKWGAISNDAKHVSYFYMTSEKWRIGFVTPDGKDSLNHLDIPADLRESKILWSPDNQELLYISNVGSVGNLKALPINGAPVRQLTNFTAQAISDFSLAPDGQRFAISRSISVNDVVLVENSLAQ